MIVLSKYLWTNEFYNFKIYSRDGYAKLWDCGKSAVISDLTKVDSAIFCCSLSSAPTFLELGDPPSTPSKLRMPPDLWIHRNEYEAPLSSNLFFSFCVYKEKHEGFKKSSSCFFLKNFIKSEGFAFTSMELFIFGKAQKNWTFWKEISI